MKKIIITIITLLLIAATAKAQFLIVTNTNDSILCVISVKDNGIFHYKTITKPRHFGIVNIKDVRIMKPIGNDTFYNVYEDMGGDYIDDEPKRTKGKLDSILLEQKTAQYWFEASGDHLENAITLQIIGAVVAGGASLVGVIGEPSQGKNTVVAGMAILSSIMNVFALAEYYNFANSYIKAGKQKKYTLCEQPIK